MGHKFGIFNPSESDRPLIGKFLNYLEANSLDFTNSFRSLNSLSFADKEFEREWLNRLNLQSEKLEEAVSLMNRVNPFIIPRNHQIEKMIKLAIDGDYSLFAKLMEVLAQPYKQEETNLEFTYSPTQEEEVKKTFCGT